MKQVLGELKRKVKQILETDIALKDRSINFQIVVSALLATAVLCITIGIIDQIP
jgi:hypothetical protein